MTRIFVALACALIGTACSDAPEHSDAVASPEPGIARGHTQVADSNAQAVPANVSAQPTSNHSEKQAGQNGS